MRALNSSLLVIALVLGASCWMMTSYETSLFTVPSDSLLRRIETVALVPVRVPDDLDVPESVLTEYDTVLESVLRLSGFAVVPAAEYSKIWSRLTQEAGGFFDPFTGRRDEPKFDAAVRQLYRELNEVAAPDALLFPEIEVVETEYFSRSAEWDGASQRVEAPGGSGWALVLSLVVVLESMDGRELYSNVQGVEIIEGPDGAAIEPPPHGDPERRTRAAMGALRPLIDLRPPTSERQPGDR